MLLNKTNVISYINIRYFHLRSGLSSAQTKQREKHKPKLIFNEKIFKNEFRKILLYYNAYYVLYVIKTQLNMCMAGLGEVLRTNNAK